MISLFKTYPSGSSGVLLPNNWQYIKTGFQYNLEKVKTFYHIYPLLINANHFLVRLIESIEVPMSQELERYYTNVDTIALNVSMNLRMTSARYKGTTFDGIFYGKGSTELLLATDDYFDYNYVNENWDRVSAIKVLLHPKSDMDMSIPVGKSYTQERGLSVIEINVPKLMVQYRAFVNAQSNNLSGVDKSIYQFIGGYVLPNMLDSHNEIALFNRIYKAAFGTLNDGTNESVFRHSFVMPNYVPFLDIAIKNILGNINVGLKTFPNVLKTLPSFHSVNMYKDLIMPDIVATTQVDWLLVASRMKVVDFLLKVTGQKAAATNQGILNQIIRCYHSNNVSNMLSEMLPTEIVEEQKLYQQHLLDAAGLSYA